ncbi:hypothetical protein JQ615_17275 [Bradyrhizobium jicamae]|uniref:Uncharacterized protein n=1 Tax=Bradyrhizobium jicamae TaxID=280332 RepID=A0ABS5FL89_9BRAD|nr:hypothetical protein [Bradyrhizobium jicamae]MBR0797146.1 hypothetical protein [Bradyrhizobium jicamae]
MPEFSDEGIVQFRALLGALLVWQAAIVPALADPMTIEFSWRGAQGCVTLFPNPEIRFRNVPSDAKLVVLTLTQGNRELGGQEVPMPVNGVLPPASIRTYAPCGPAVYQFTAVAKSNTGKILAEARQARFYPSDDLVPEKPSQSSDK